MWIFEASPIEISEHCTAVGDKEQKNTASVILVKWNKKTLPAQSKSGEEKTIACKSPVQWGKTHCN